MYTDRVKVGIGNIMLWITEIEKEKLDTYDSLDTAERLIKRIIAEAEGMNDDILNAYDELEE